MRDLTVSLAFWSGLCGFAVRYERVEDVADIEPLLASLRQAAHPLFMEPEARWYTVGGEDAGVTQFLVADPDGYLVRFQASIGRRPVIR